MKNATPEKVFVFYNGRKIEPFLEYLKKILKNEANVVLELASQEALHENCAVISFAQKTDAKKAAERAAELLGGECFQTSESFAVKKCGEFSCVASLSHSGLICGLVEVYHQIKKHASAGDKICLENINSSPAVKNRFYHICMSGTTPNIKSLLEMARTIKLFGYNGIVLEFENKFPYRENNSFLHPDHYSLNDIKKIRKIGDDFGLQIVPLLQCLGHLEYILKYDEFKDLCEVEGFVKDACPFKERTFELFKQFAEEILEQFPGAKFFHIGADEVRRHGECPECRKHEAEHGKYSAFAMHVKKVTDYLLAKGIQPMMWDDIIYRHYPDVKLAGLSKKTIIVNWEYWCKNSARAPEVVYAPGSIGITVSKERVFNTERFAPEEHDGEKIEYNASGFFEDNDWASMEVFEFIKTDDFPCSVKAFPVIDMIKKDGFVPAGASNVRKSLQGTGNQDFIQRVLNNKAWGEKLKESKVDFMIATSWGRGNSLGCSVFNMELMLYTLASGGYFGWRGGGSIEEFNDFFENYIYSAKSQPKLSITFYEMFKGLYSLRCPAFNILLRDNLPELKKSKIPFYEMLYLYVRLFVFNRGYEQFSGVLKKVLYRIETERDYPGTEKKRYMDGLNNFQSQIKDIEKEAGEILKKYVLPLEAEELAISLLYYEKKEVKSLMECIVDSKWS